MTTPRDMFQTVMSWMVICPLKPIFNRPISEDMAGDFFKVMLETLVRRGFGPDACGYNHIKKEAYFVYQGIIQATAVREAIYESYIEAQNMAAKEERRLKALRNMKNKFGDRPPTKGTPDQN